MKNISYFTSLTECELFTQYISRSKSKNWFIEIREFDDIKIGNIYIFCRFCECIRSSEIVLRGTEGFITKILYFESSRFEWSDKSTNTPKADKILLSCKRKLFVVSFCYEFANLDLIYLEISTNDD